jgi:hypothetical protein
MPRVEFEHTITEFERAETCPARVLRSAFIINTCQMKRCVPRTVSYRLIEAYFESRGRESMLIHFVPLLYYQFHVFKILFPAWPGRRHLCTNRHIIDRFLGNYDQFVVVLINILVTSIMCQGCEHLGQFLVVHAAFCLLLRLLTSRGRN